MSLSTTPNHKSFYYPLIQLFNRTVALIADLRLAIFLLLAIAIFSISGTVIEQNQSPSFYQENYPESPALFGFLTWQVILSVGLDRVYTTWWYLALLVLFGSSLVACTFKRQLPALKATQSWQYYRQARQFQKLALSSEINLDSTNFLAELLKNKGYKVFLDRDSIYAQKGISGRIGPIIVHLGLIFVLIGAILGAFTGFFAQEMIASGATFKIKNIFEAGIFANLQKTQDFSVKVNKFWIDYSPTGAVDQFYSDLSITDGGGKELKRKTIFVNEPLRYRGVTFYQTNWGIAGIKIQLNNSPIFELPMAELNPSGKGRLWGSWIPTKPDLSEGVSLITKDLQGTMFIYDSQGKLVNATRPGMSTQVNGVNLKVLELIGSTGLQIKSDPGVPVVYGGFALLMLGVVMSYVSYSQIWGLKQGDRFFIGGKTNRAQVVFERELGEIIEKISMNSRSQPAR